jgi:polyphosphate kinase
MRTIKFIKKFFSKKDVLKAASYFKEQYKKNGQKIIVEIIAAYKIQSSIKRSIGSPRPDDFIIIIKHQEPGIIKKAIQKITKKVTTIVKQVLKPKPVATGKAFMEVNATNYTTRVYLNPSYDSNVIPLIAPIILSSRV